MNVETSRKLENTRSQKVYADRIESKEKKKYTNSKGSDEIKSFFFLTC